MRLAPPILLFAALLLGGCSQKRHCYEGDFEACTCADGQPGFAACDAEKDAYGACGYCGSLPGSAASAGGGGAGGSGGSGGTSSGGTSSSTSSKLPFLSDCSTNDDCQSGLCFHFNAKGPKCTITCQADNDCPPPSPGCSGMKVCKTP